MIVNFTMSVSGIAEFQDLSIADTIDDGFVTETGIKMDSELVTILDPNMDIRAYLVFRLIEINSYESLTNATLRLRTASSLPEDSGSRVTIYGVDDGNFPGFTTAAQIIAAPLTSSRVNLDTSTFYGSRWVEIDVTDIVAELKSNPTWEGDDAFTGTIGFIFHGAEGHDGRVFYDKLAGNGLEAQLIIHWGEDPDPPPDTETPPVYDDYVVEFENTTSGHIDPTDNETGWDGEIYIFKYTDYGDPTFQVFSLEHTTYDAYYFNVTNGIGSEIEWATGMGHPSSGCATTPIIGIYPWTLILADPGDVALFVSNDEMVTSNHYHPNDAYANLASYGGNVGSMVIDPDGVTIHLVYTSVTPGQPAVYNVIYTNFTLNRVTGIPTFAPSYTNISQVGANQYDPVIYVQPNGTLHVAWFGEQGTNTDQVWYRRRHANGTWLAQVRVSDTDIALDYNRNPDVVANDETGDALIVWTYDVDAVHWDIIFPNNTASPADRIIANARYPSMVNDRENNVANLVYQQGASGVIYYRNMTITNSSSWSVGRQVSPAAQKHKEPDIGFNPINRSLSVVWYNDWNTQTAGNWWPIGAIPIPGKTQLTNAQLSYNFIEEEVKSLITDEVWFIAFSNGTVIGGPYDNYDDAEEAAEIIFDIDPEDPNPSSKDWDQTGSFTRFKTRLYILLIGIFMVLGPLFVWAMSRPSGYEFVIGIFVMFVGYALMLAAAQV